MPVNLSPAVAPTIKSESVAVSASYPNLSTFSFSIKAAGGYRPNFGQTIRDWLLPLYLPFLLDQSPIDRLAGTLIAEVIP